MKRNEGWSVVGTYLRAGGGQALTWIRYLKGFELLPQVTVRRITFSQDVGTVNNLTSWPSDVFWNLVQFFFDT